MSAYVYRAFGLTIASEIECPELLAADGSPDVTFRYGPTPKALDNPTHEGVLFQAEPNRSLIKLEHVARARFLVQNGNEVIIERQPEADDDTVRTFLLATCMGTLLYQRGWLPFHGSAIATSRGAVVFSGASGSGKSTLAAAFRRRGYRVLADDISVITFDESGAPLVHPGYPGLKLWSDSATQLGQQVEALPRVRPQLEKYRYDIRSDFVHNQQRLFAIYIIQESDAGEVRLETVTGMSKLLPLRTNVYLDRYLTRQESRFQQPAHLAKHVHVHRVTRSDDFSKLDKLVQMIEEDLT